VQNFLFVSSICWALIKLGWAAYVSVQVQQYYEQLQTIQRDLNAASASVSTLRSFSAELEVKTLQLQADTERLGHDSVSLQATTHQLQSDAERLGRDAFSLQANISSLQALSSDLLSVSAALQNAGTGCLNGIECK